MKAPEFGGHVACKVFNPVVCKSNLETDAMKEFRIMAEIKASQDNCDHILTPLKFVHAGSISETNERTGRVSVEKDRQIILSELCSEGDLFNYIQTHEPLLPND